MKQVDVVVSGLGEGVTDAFLVSWFKTVGETVDADEPIAEVMTDKANIDILAPAAGTLVDCRVGADERVKVGEVIAIIHAA